MNNLKGNSTKNISDEFVLRLKNFYRCCVLDNPESEVWDPITSMNRPIHDSLLSDDESLKRMLMDPVKTNLFYGVDNLAVGVLGEDPYVHQTSEHQTFIYKSLEKLATQIGLEKLSNPEYQGDSPKNYPWGGGFSGRNSLKIVENFLDEIDHELDVNLRFQNPFNGEIGLSTSRGIVSTRSVSAVYYAWRIKQWESLTQSKEVIEIGPGMGRVLKLTYEMQYGVTGVDLPLGLIGSALFLASTLGEDLIQLHGEKNSDSPKIKLVPADKFDGKDKKYGIALNTDSLTEMSYGVAHDYLEKLEKCCEIFISINHESNSYTVADVANQFPNFKKLYRAPFLLREGYLEEVYILPKSRLAGI
jgi:hypothetical protein